MKEKIESLRPYCGIDIGRIRRKLKYPVWEHPIVGFDTEYTSKGAELISFQLYAPPNKAVFVEVKKGEVLAPEWLYDEILLLLDHVPRKVILATYFSLAELQFLPVYTEGFNIREYAGGSLDVSFKVNNTELAVFDLARWFERRKLADVAESFGYEKLVHDTTNVTRRSIRSAKFRDYARRDAKLCFDILHDLRKVFMEETGTDPLPSKTPASASANAFRRLHVEEDIFCDNDSARTLAMRGCWGGRAEVFRRGRLPSTYHEYDIKSAYPNAAIHFGELPCQESWRERRSWKQIEKDRGGFAHVRFRFPHDFKYPCLPVAVKGAILHPSEGESYATFSEVLYAIELGADCRLVEAWGYRRGTRALADYLEWTLDKRDSATGAAAFMYKLLGNSIIGKLAQGLRKIPLDEYMRFSREHGYTLDELFGCWQDELVLLGLKEAVSVGAIFMPEWNGLICGLTRRVLAEMLVSSEGIYCHTDSVWGKKKPTGDILPFELKKSGPATCIRRGLACIGSLDEQTEHLARHSIWDRETARTILADFTGPDIIIKYEKSRPLKFKEAYRAGKPVGTWVTQTRTASTVWDNRRKLLRNGRTRPWRNGQEYLDEIKTRR